VIHDWIKALKQNSWLQYKLFAVALVAGVKFPQSDYGVFKMRQLGKLPKKGLLADS
jgi:hypothetical protein